MTAGRRPAVAVFGATGCVGRAVTAAFAAAGSPVLRVARRRPPDTTGRFLALDAAATDPAELAGLLAAARVDTVVNATGGWVTGEAENDRVHARLVENLLAALARLPDRIRLVQIGSVHEYGPLPVGTAAEETRAPRPVTAYGRSKLAGAEAVLDATRAGLVDGVVLRVVNLCGPGAEVGFLGAALRRLLAATPERPAELTVADARRDFLDVRDLAAAVLAAATAPVVGQVINVGRGEAVPVARLLDLLVAAAGPPPGAVRLRTAPVESRGGDWTRVDIGRAARSLGWRPALDLPESIKDMWDASRADHPVEQP
ncbi:MULTISPECIES: NAD(P)-dependent oxidoreductase [unclassified Streptomyces]|uniref:NAD-dependent epimerase/dehydratase family protein n=1 Tax=unclassified Streptomyces TaxID=2593676 RepID=UPI0006FE0DE7|nr:MULTISPECIES: NAD(P)-dependent oxidoreductase [unclassified Streptomyces]KQX56386.1 NAD-dependent epimerase [Streptomyces sp. Root1304]KRA97200.1 NAD-dependent epimerase [Streptomyces sp. Root66D1]